MIDKRNEIIKRVKMISKYSQNKYFKKINNSFIRANKKNKIYKVKLLIYLNAQNCSAKKYSLNLLLLKVLMLLSTLLKS